MHSNALKLARDFAAKHLPDQTQTSLLEVGSYDVNGSYREVFTSVREYVGLDIRPGPGVDVVATEYAYPLWLGRFELIVCGQVLEHVEKPWLVVAEIARIVRPGGLVYLAAPWRWEVHDFPRDCWRLLPDGMKALMRDAGIEAVECFMDEDDTVGIGRRA